MKKNINCNQFILEALLKSKEVLSEEAQSQIKSFLGSQKSEVGGFTNRAGKADLYYSVFGYTLALILDVKLDVLEERKYLKRIKYIGKLDFVHSMCFVRCDFLLHLIDLRQKSRLSASKFLTISFAKDLILAKVEKSLKNNCSELLWELEENIANDGGYNHNKKGAARSTIYANYLMWTLYQDLQTDQDVLDEITDANRLLRAENGSFANEENSIDGVTSSTAAGLIMSSTSELEELVKTKDWLKQMLTKRGGFKAGEGVPVADLLSTSTALLALQVTGENMQDYAENSVNFINLHWDESGGFFGSIADMTCDVEYTYYALLGLGVLS
ncbi:terpene cyclase/mutase family protein [Labilibaculum sp. K2S]|uniref:prenyltransferase/squalene oxidase repeat-containing protein n=1 Tax=Labilibaculum sp. K2S TaxID=3056386 RepID=UPI0025A4A366|nr:prenyltransferase/squalene oxidase repeat-containing protein [Labilibaculum sp. K2S]MDM8160841.1 terpene cyclase/mutase family protein [Labilibaculum sp. K2S]